MFFSSEIPIVNIQAACINGVCLENYSFAYNQSFQFNDTWPPDNLVCIFEPQPQDFIASTIFQICVYFMYSTIFIVALIGNGLVCFIVYNTPSMKTVTNYFIVNLAVGDILLTLFCVPFSFVSMLVLRYWPFGAVMCKVVNFSQAVSVLVSAYTLLAISIDRYMAIMHPLKPRLEKAAAKMVVALVWSGALFTATPIPVTSQLLRPSPWHTACEVDVCGEKWADVKQSEQYTCALLVLQFVIPLIALLCTYGRIGFVVWGRRPPGEAHGIRDSRIQRSKRKMIKMIATVVAVFIICWLPLNIFIVMWTIYGTDEQWATWPGMPYVWFTCHWLAMSHSCYNPIIYCYMNARYRRGFKQVLGGLPYLKFIQRRSRHRSTNREGIPMSELVGVNVPTIRRRTDVRNKCHLSSNDPTCPSSRCTTCASYRLPKILGPTSSSMAMAHLNQSQFF